MYQTEKHSNCIANPMYDSFSGHEICFKHDQIWVRVGLDRVHLQCILPKKLIQEFFQAEINGFYFSCPWVPVFTNQFNV
jgi:hypothetical protein